MDSEVSEIIQTYKDAACYPSPGSALLQRLPEDDLIKIFSTWSIPDLIRSESTKFNREFLLQYKSEGFVPLFQGIPSDASSVSQFAFTKSFKKYAVFRKTNKKSDESIFLEIWNSSHKERTYDMTDRKEHGKILDNGSFQAFEWSSNEKYLLYIAEAKEKKSESFFKDLFCENEQKMDDKAPDEKTPGEENAYRESWGECNANVHHTVLCIFDTETGKVEVVNLDDKYPDRSVAQATWGPNDEYIVFVGFKEAPFRLGLIYCSNRSSSIFSYNLKTKNVACLTSEEDICVECPVFSPNFEMFVFLQVKTGGPHRSCEKLLRYDWKEKKISTVIDIVDVNDSTKKEEFAGVYISKLSSQWWCKDSELFFFHNYRRSFVEIFCVHVFSKQIQKINIDKSFGTWVLHDVQDPYILTSVSSPNKLPQLMIGYFSVTQEKDIQVTWNLVDDNSVHELKDLSWGVHTLSPSLPHPTFPHLDYDIIVVSSNEKKNGTLIIFPHGGPHSVFVPDYSAYVAAFARLGYIVCEVNYRGSIGFGEFSVLSLLGNIGTQDVSDVINAVDYLKKNSEFGIKQVVGFGGSHGGFLITHLLGQYPDLLKAAVVRNPVVDLTSMVGVTDIPDWCCIEAGCSDKYNPSEFITSSDLKEMWERSPIKYIEKVKSPTLLALGKNDLRVPPSQGLLFHKYLRVKNVPSKVYFYDDNHGLSKVGNSSDGFVQIASWFQKHSST